MNNENKTNEPVKDKTEQTQINKTFEPKPPEPKPLPNPTLTTAANPTMQTTPTQLPSKETLRNKLEVFKQELIAKYGGQRGHNPHIVIARDIEPVLLKLKLATTKVDEAIVKEVDAALAVKIEDVKFFEVSPEEAKKKPVAS